MYQLRIERIYQPETPEDGCRILVDRLWPRGISKVKADLNEWDKNAAPDNVLRKQFHDGQESYEQFKQDYIQELNNNPEALSLLNKVKEELQNRNVTLLYASKDMDHNNAVVLKEWLEQHLADSSK